MKKKNILYNILNFILIVFALFYFVPMFYSISIGGLNIFDFYSKVSFFNMILTFSTFFIINLVLGIINIRKKNTPIGILSIISGCLAILNIIPIFIYNETFDSPWGLLVFISLFAQIIMSIIILVLNRKKENTGFNKVHLVFCVFIVLVGIILIAIPRVLLKENSKRITEAYNILSKESKQQLFISRDSFFYDTNGNLVAYNDYRILDVNKVDDKGTFFISIIDKENQLWIVDYSGNKLVRLYYAFVDNRFFIDTLCTFSNIDGPKTDLTKDGINYLTAQTITKDHLVFTNEQNNISIEVEIDYSQKEFDSSFLDLLSPYCNSIGIHINNSDLGVDLKSIYTYKKEYYLTYNNNEQIKLDCNNLLIEYNPTKKNYVLLMYNNWNIPFYDETETGYFDLKGNKYTISDRNIIVYNTFDNYIIMYNTLEHFFYISSLDFQSQEKVQALTHCSENYVLAKDELYLIKNNKIVKMNEQIKYTVNIGKDDPKSFFGSVYYYYIEYMH